MRTAIGINLNKNTFSRAELRQVSMAFKGKKWIPNWITHDLAREIEGQYPSAEEINTNSLSECCSRDLDAFKVKCSIIFPVDRIFMSFTQFVQAAKYFLAGWNIKGSHAGKSYRCYYGLSSGRSEYKSKCNISDAS